MAKTQKTHWGKFMNKEFLGVWDLPTGGELVGAIKSARTEKVAGADGKREDCFVVHFLDLQKPMICNTTNAKMIAKVLGSDYVEDWYGKKIQIGSEKVKAFGTVTDALRVRDVKVNDEKPVYCESCGQEIIGAFGMTGGQMAAYTKNKYGKQLCAECAQGAKNGGEN